MSKTKNPATNPPVAAEQAAPLSIDFRTLFPDYVFCHNFTERLKVMNDAAEKRTAFRLDANYHFSPQSHPRNPTLEVFDAIERLTGGEQNDDLFDSHFHIGNRFEDLENLYDSRIRLWRSEWNGSGIAIPDHRVEVLIFREPPVFQYGFPDTENPDHVYTNGLAEGIDRTVPVLDCTSDTPSWQFPCVPHCSWRERPLEQLLENRWGVREFCRHLEVAPITMNGRSRVALCLMPVAPGRAEQRLKTLVTQVWDAMRVIGGVHVAVPSRPRNDVCGVDLYHALFDGLHEWMTRFRDADPLADEVRRVKSIQELNTKYKLELPVTFKAEPPQTQPARTIHELRCLASCARQLIKYPCQRAIGYGPMEYDPQPSTDAYRKHVDNANDWMTLVGGSTFSGEAHLETEEDYVRAMTDLAEWCEQQAKAIEEPPALDDDDSEVHAEEKPKLSKKQKSQKVLDAIIKRCGCDITKRDWPAKCHAKIAAVRASDIQADTGIPDSTFVNYDAWKNFSSRREELETKSKAANATNRGVPTRTGNRYQLDDIAPIAETDPLDDVHQRGRENAIDPRTDDEIWESIVEKAKPTERERLEEMKPKERKELIEIVRTS
jgi:hypothetical protein